MGDRILDWISDHVFACVVIIFLAVFTLLCLWAAWEQNKLPTMTLTKADWACTQNQTIPVTTFIKSGDVMVPVTTYAQQCQQWSRQK